MEAVVVNNSSNANDKNLNALVSSVTVLIAGMAFCINTFLLIIIFRHRYFNKRIYRLIFIATVSDIVANFSLNMYYTYSIGNIFNLLTGRWFCRIVTFTLSTSSAVWALILCLLAVSRYILISSPTVRCCSIIRNYVALIGQIAVAIIAVSISLPLLYFIDVYKDEPDFCDIPHVSFNISAYLIIHTSIIYIIPTTFLIAVYWKIIHYVIRYVRPRQINLVGWTEFLILQQPYLWLLLNNRNVKSEIGIAHYMHLSAIRLRLQQRYRLLIH
ncbi:hypothetical protein TrispH2_011523 [Trichoplax sp. H2]|nr:hypothetical protein TrispH2_011523 [Trichoplax sp. H2]|eukprot:RDD36403.1 hypothetical protein TrispH2_011523 [Trichoplax sp. H2]